MTGASGKDVEHRSVKVGLIEQVKNLRAELHVDLLACLENLVGRKIDIVKTRARDGVSSQVPIGSCCRSRKRARVIPQLRSSQRCSGGYTGATGGNSVCGSVAENGIQVRAGRK